MTAAQPCEQLVQAKQAFASEAGDVTGDAIASEAVSAIEDLLAWSRDALSGLIGLGTLIRYVQTGGPLALIVVRIERELDRTEAALALLPGHLARLRDIARRGHDADEQAAARTAHQLLAELLDATTPPRSRHPHDKNLLTPTHPEDRR